MANALRYGFRPHGAGHQVVEVTLGGTVTKGDLLSDQGTVFAPASHSYIAGVVLKSGVSGDKVPLCVVGPETVLEVATGLTYAQATHAGNAYDVTGTTGAQYLTTTQTYQHFIIVGVYPTPGAPDTSGANTNVLVRPNVSVSLTNNPRRLALRRSSATLSGATSVSTLIPAQVYALDPGGAHRNVTLPEAQDGLYFRFVNKADAAENLVILDADTNTVATIGQNEAADVYCTGTTWSADGFSVAAV